MSERKVTMSISFHADMPDDPDEAETFADSVENWVIETLQNKRPQLTGVAFESFAEAGWDDEALDE